MLKSSTSPGWSSPLSAVLAGVFVAGLLILIFQHWMYALLWLPYVLILACPIMMFLMMRNMNGPQQK